MEPVESSFIARVGHDPATDTLRVEMKSGKVYDHPGISASAHAEMMAAPSIGTHYNVHIKAPK